MTADRRSLLRLLFAGMIVYGIVRTLAGVALEAPLTLVPWRPPEPPPAFRAVDRLEATAGGAALANVLLVTLDTTRVDRIGIYGNSEIDTGNIDRLASRGALFTNAVAVAPSTLPSHTSILTGLYPLKHGVRANGLFELDGDQVTLAEILRSHGYATAAFTSAFVLDSEFGLAQGFDVYDDETPIRGAFEVPERRANETTDRALAWLRQTREGPFFAWVHYFDAHAYYEHPEPYKSKYKLAYDGEIAFVDAQLGRVLQWVEEQDRKTIVVVVADHGEALGEQGEGSHGILVSEATVRVPLVIYVPGVSAGVRIDSRVSQIDLMPTLLSLLGIPAPPGLDGIDLTGQLAQREIYTENLEARARYGWHRTSALYGGNLKYVEGAKAELYDLAADPRESVDLADARSVDLARLEWRAREIRSSGDDLVVPRLALAREEERKLAALGYVSSKGGAIRAGGVGPDPRRWLPLFERMQTLIGVSRQPQPWWARLLPGSKGLPRNEADLTRKCERIADENPDFAPIYYSLIELYRQAGRPEDAERSLATLRRLLRASSADPAPKD